MRWLQSPSAAWALALLGVLAALAAAVPVPEPQPAAFAQALADAPAQMPLELQERLRTLQLDEQQLEQVTRDKRTISILRSLFPGLGQNELNPEENQLAGAESQVSEVRAQYADENPYVADQDAAATGGNDAPDQAAIAVPLEDENVEDADRSKRQFSIGGGSGGGSGNFLFDIIRLVTGGSSGGGASHEASTDGSGAGGEKDEGYGAGVPGPVTRLFVIANRGIANLVQDLILRIAQTSERLVNFKARLITSII